MKWLLVGLLIILMGVVCAADFQVGVKGVDDVAIGEEVRFTLVLESDELVKNIDGFFLYNHEVIEFEDNFFSLDRLDGVEELEFSFNAIDSAYETIVYPLVKSYIVDNNTEVYGLGNYSVNVDNLSLEINFNSNSDVAVQPTNEPEVIKAPKLEDEIDDPEITQNTLYKTQESYEANEQEEQKQEKSVEKEVVPDVNLVEETEEKSYKWLYALIGILVVMIVAIIAIILIVKKL